MFNLRLIEKKNNASAKSSPTPDKPSPTIPKLIEEALFVENSFRLNGSTLFNSTKSKNKVTKETSSFPNSNGYSKNT